MRIIPSTIASVVILLGCLPTALALPTYTLLAENNFSGRVTQVTLADWDWINVGDVVAGTRILGDFALYDAGEDDGSMYFESKYTFFGVERNYEFYIGGGPHTMWGQLIVDPNQRLEVRHNNNFFSDGLERTFHNEGHDYGFFYSTLENYTTPGLRGSGSFGWEGITVDFDIGPSASVPEPSSLLLLMGGLFVLVAARTRSSRRCRACSIGVMKYR